MSEGPEQTALEVHQAPALPAMAPMAPMEPAIRLANAKKVALLLADVIEERKLYSPITNYNPRTKKQEVKKHVRFEGWTTAGALCGQVLGDGVFPVSVWTRPLPFPAGTNAEDFQYQRGKDDWAETITPAVYGFEARVEARTYSGAIVAAAEAEVTRAEKRWAKADDYAIRSMVQTRAGSKALRVPLGWIISLSGFAETPAEEMTPEMGEDDQTAKKAPAGKTLTKEWGCAACRTVNAKSRKTCKGCGRKRGTPVEETEAARAGGVAVAEEFREKAGAPLDPAELAEGNWRCSDCSTVNASNDTACRKCGVVFQRDGTPTEAEAEAKDPAEQAAQDVAAREAEKGAADQPEAPPAATEAGTEGAGPGISPEDRAEEAEREAADVPFE